MSMSTHVVGIKPPDDKWKEMKAVYDACAVAGVAVPKAVCDFFDNDPPDDAGVVVSEYDLKKCGALKEYSGDMTAGFEVDLSKVPKDVKIIRFYNSY